MLVGMKRPLPLVALVFLSSLTPAQASDPRPIQLDFPVNGTSVGDQAAPAVATSDNGEFVVVWTSDGQDGDQRGIYARLYDDDATALGNEFRVNVTTAGDQSAPAVSSTDNGHFAIAWVGPDGNGLGVFARAYEPNGTPSSGEVAVNTTTSGDQITAAVAISEDGDFLVVWQGPGPEGVEVFGRLFTETGSPLTPEFQINTSDLGDQEDPSVASSDERDEFFVAWTGFDADGRGIFAQRISSAGALLGAEIGVNTTTLQDQTHPAVAASGLDLDLEDENLFVVVWQGFDADGSGIFFQRFEDDGTPRGGEERANLDELGNQENPAVSADDGDGSEIFFVVTWQEFSSDLFASRGVPILVRGRRIRGSIPTTTTAATRINASVTPATEPEVASRSDGWFTSVWQSSDASGAGIFARQFLIPLFADGFDSGDTSAWSAAVPAVKPQP
jgi:hypothetical protein